MLRVFKFGGALMNDASGLVRVGEIVGEYACEQLVVVVSAFGKTTNALENLLKLKNENNIDTLASEFFKLKQFHLSIINELFQNDSPANDIEDLFANLWDALNEKFENNYFAYDSIVSFGELFSATIVNAVLKKQNLSTEFVDSSKIILTDSNFTSARINWKYTSKLIESRLPGLLNSGKTIVTQGFTAADETGNITTLGREGSDFTASIIGSILNADDISIWKDVPGLMNADPKKFDDSLKLDQISYHEAIELAFYGASVIHPKTIQPLKAKNISLNVRSFYSPELKPSVISSENEADSEVSKIILKENQVLMSFTSRNLEFIDEDSLSEIFKALSLSKIHVNVMQNSAVSFSVCFDYDEMKLKVLSDILSEKFYLKYNTGLQLITIRHYSDKLIEKLTKGKEIYLEQKSRSTLQVLVKN